MQSWHDESIERAAINDEVRRVLAARNITACTGPRDQGRKLCPCPDACERTDDALDSAIGVVNGIVLSLAIWAIFGAVWVALS
jgi:hypothetical protein